MILLVLALLTAAPDAGVTPPPDQLAAAASLRARATKAYRAHKYAEACPLFAQARSLSPKDGALASDLGLCLVRQGEKQKARRVLEEAFNLAPDEQTRRGVIFNLALLGEDLAPTRDCRSLPAAAGCDKPVSICVASYRLAGPAQEGMSGNVAGIATDPGKAPHGANQNASDIESCASEDDPFKCAFELLSGNVLELSAEGDGPEGGSPLRRCRVVYANACMGQVFAACTDLSEKRPKESIATYRFQ